ncbi:hypothetical protein EG835_14540, partial [bacterium]|nr:hypothetical protein [bacterium]
MGAERARVHRYRCVIAGDLADGSFPRSGGEDYLSDPEVIRSFAAAGVDLSPRSGIDEERLLFYQVVTRATDRLVLSRQTHDDNGRPVRGSTFVDEVLDLYRDPETRMHFNGAPPCRSLGLDGLVQHEQAPRTERRTLRAHASDDKPHSNERVEEARRRAARVVNPLSEAARRQAEEREAFSASELETYLQCPFRWCIQRLVQPRELDDTLDAAAAGSVSSSSR